MKKRSSDRFQIGQLARSKKGRDKDHLYVIVGMDSRFLYGADGSKWTVARPKKKNRSHLQLIQVKTDGSHEKLDDVDIVKAISAFENRKGN